MNHSGTTYGLKSSASGLQRKREKGARNVKKEEVGKSRLQVTDFTAEEALRWFWRS